MGLNLIYIQLFSSLNEKKLMEIVFNLHILKKNKFY